MSFLLVVGLSFFNLFIAFTTKNKVMLTIKKAKTAFRNNQYASTEAPASRAVFTARNFSHVGLDNTKNRLEKSGTLSIHEIVGIIISSTNDLTIVENAAPITIPMAMSIIFPFMANSLKSFSI